MTETPREPDAPGAEAAPGPPPTGEDVCPRCGGSGRVEGGECPECRGTGRGVEGGGGGRRAGRAAGRVRAAARRPPRGRPDDARRRTVAADHRAEFAVGVV